MSVYILTLTGFMYRGITSHKFTPMPGVHKPLQIEGHTKMNRDDQQVPEAIKRLLRPMLLDQLRETPILDIYELELFDWYVRETEELLNGMLSAEGAYIQEQIETEIQNINDSGMVAVEYYLERIRYSHVIYMTSLLETFLERSCGRLTTIVGKHNLPFTATELKGDQWSVKRKFLERYGKFSIPKNVWAEIQVLILLRNNIVHDNGSTRELKPKEKTMLAKRPGVKLSGHEVVIEAEYVRSAFKAIKYMVQFIEAQLGEVVGRAIRPRTVR
jgi:hypothetical protein